MTTRTEIAGVPGHLARPQGAGPWPALIVIQEWWGLSAHIQSVADRFASVGYLAFAPDLFHGELAELGDNEKATALIKKYGAGAAAELQEVFDGLKKLPECNGKVGSVGFCFGGQMSLRLGVSRPVDAVCMFYGGGMQQVFGQLGNLKSPLLGLFGDQDRSIPVGSVQEFDQLLDETGVQHEVVIYPGAGHAFFRDSDPSTYRAAAAQDAWDRATHFFQENLS
jgi:carboxymethylenebutenolidase